MSGRDGALYEEALAVRTLAAELEGEDLELSIASQTNFVEAAEAVLDAIRDAETMRDAILARMSALNERAGALDRRQDRLRDLLTSAMATAGQKTLRLPEATLSLSEPAPTAVVMDAETLPDLYVDTKVSSRPNMRRITEALRSGRDVPGAVLNNGPPRLSIRTK